MEFKNCDSDISDTSTLIKLKEELLMLMANPRINKAAHLGLVTQRNICGAKERNDLNEIMKNLWTCRRGHFLKYPFLTSELQTESCLPLTVLEQQLVRILVTILKLVYGTRLELEEKV